MSKPHKDRFLEAGILHCYRTTGIDPTYSQSAGPLVPELNRDQSHREAVEWEEQGLNVGVICGAASRLIVADIHEDEDKLEIFRTLGLSLTPLVITPEGRFHFYYRHPGFPVHTRIRLGGFGLDLRGDGDFVIGAGSARRDGGHYTWALDPCDVEYATLPINIFALCRDQFHDGPFVSDLAGVLEQSCLNVACARARPEVRHPISRGAPVVPACR